MNNKIWTGVVIVAILAVIGGMMYSSQPVVSAQGTANIKVVPDIVSVNLNVLGKGANLSEANQKAQEIGDALLMNLIRLGYERNELKFVNYNSYENFDWSSGRQKSLGWIVSEQLVVKTNETSEVLQIVNAAIDANAQVSYINFEVSDMKQKELKSEALEAASKDAKAKAEAIAFGQGKSLGRLVGIENLDIPNFYPYPMYASADMSSGNAEAMKVATNIAPNEQEITASVKASYKLSIF